MSFFTTFLETTPHFGRAIEQTEQELKTIKFSGAERLKLLVHLAYCYAHVLFSDLLFILILKNQNFKYTNNWFFIQIETLKKGSFIPIPGL